MKKNITKQEKPTIPAEEFDERFDRGEDMMPYLDLDSAVWRANVDFPTWAIHAMDKEAERVGITRQALIKVWICERLDAINPPKRKAAGG